MRLKYMFIFVALNFLCGCSSTSDGPTYSAKNIGQVSNVDTGVIIDIQVVNIKGTHETGERMGALGGAFGAVVGSSGGYVGRVAGATVGAIAGGLAGGATQEAITSGEAYQFIIKKNNGKVISVLQTDDNHLEVGNEVTILESGGNTRIIPN